MIPTFTRAFCLLHFGTISHLSIKNSDLFRYKGRNIEMKGRLSSVEVHSQVPKFFFLLQPDIGINVIYYCIFKPLEPSYSSKWDRMLSFYVCFCHTHNSQCYTLYILDNLVLVTSTFIWQAVNKDRQAVRIVGNMHGFLTAPQTKWSSRLKHNIFFDGNPWKFIDNHWCQWKSMDFHRKNVAF